MTACSQCSLICMDVHAHMLPVYIFWPHCTSLRTSLNKFFAIPSPCVYTNLGSACPSLNVVKAGLNRMQVSCNIRLSKAYTGGSECHWVDTTVFQLFRQARRAFRCAATVQILMDWRCDYCSTQGLTAYRCQVICFMNLHHLICAFFHVVIMTNDGFITTCWTFLQLALCCHICQHWKLEENINSPVEPLGVLAMITWCKMVDSSVCGCTAFWLSSCYVRFRSYYQRVSALHHASLTRRALAYGGWGRDLPKPTSALPRSSVNPLLLSLFSISPSSPPVTEGSHQELPCSKMGVSPLLWPLSPKLTLEKKAELSAEWLIQIIVAFSCITLLFSLTLSLLFFQSSVVSGPLVN